MKFICPKCQSEKTEVLEHFEMHASEVWVVECECGKVFKVEDISDVYEEE